MAANKLTTRGTRSIAWVPVVAVAVFVAAPQLAQVVYAFFSGSGGFTGLEAIVEDGGLVTSLPLTLILAVSTVVVLVLALVPAVVAVKLWAPRLAGLLEVLCTLPLVIPSIALVAGLMTVLRGLSSMGRGSIGADLSRILQADQFPIALVGTYVILCLPFTYRSVNAALSVIPLKVFYEASNSLGGGTWVTLARVIMPNIQGSIVFSAFFAFALAFGEYTVAATMGVNTFPVWMTTLSHSDFRASIVLSIFSTVLTWGFLAFATVYASRFSAANSRRRRPKRSTSNEQVSHDQQ